MQELPSVANIPGLEEGHLHHASCGVFPPLFSRVGTCFSGPPSDEILILSPLVCIPVEEVHYLLYPNGTSQPVVSEGEAGVALSLPEAETLALGEPVGSAGPVFPHSQTSF